MNAAANKMLQEKSADWVHICLRNPVPPIADGSYNHLLWELVGVRPNDLVVGDYFAESWECARNANAAVIQLESKSIWLTTQARRIDQLLGGGRLSRARATSELREIAIAVQQSGAYKVLLWGANKALPGLRHFLPDHLIAFAQRHYDYPVQDCHYESADIVVMQTRGQLKHAFARLTQLSAFPLVIPNGVDTVRFAPATVNERQDARKRFGLDSKSFVIVIPSKIAPQKGSRYLIRWIDWCNQAVPDAVFFVVGALHHSLPARDRRELATRLGSDPNVRWIPGIANRDMHNVYKAADICLMPCLWREGFSMSALEAMASGLPIVAPNTGCYKEIAVSDYNALLVEPEYLFDGICKAIQRLHQDCDLARSIGRNARRYVEQKLGRDKVIRNFHRFLDGEYTSIDETLAPIEHVGLVSPYRYSEPRESKWALRTVGPEVL